MPVSIKKYLIQFCTTLPLIEGCENNQVILVTPTGIIAGTPASKSEEADDAKRTSEDFINAVFLNASKSYLDENKEELAPNDGYILLNNVTIRPVGSHVTTSLPSLIVFYDQIIGVTIGSI